MQIPNIAQSLGLALLRSSVQHHTSKLAMVIQFMNEFNWSKVYHIKILPLTLCKILSQESDMNTRLAASAEGRQWWYFIAAVQVMLQT